ncbi:hypothetical protein ACWGUP_26875 [Streptomyces diastaticus]
MSADYAAAADVELRTREAHLYLARPGMAEFSEIQVRTVAAAPT